MKIVNWSQWGLFLKCIMQIVSLKCNHPLRNSSCQVNQIMSSGMTFGPRSGIHLSMKHHLTASKSNSQVQRESYRVNMTHIDNLEIELDENLINSEDFVQGATS